MPTKLTVSFLLGALIFWGLSGRPAAMVAPAVSELTIRDMASGSIVYSGSADNYLPVNLHGSYRFSYHDGRAYCAKYTNDTLRAVLIDCTDNEASIEWGPANPIVQSIQADWAVLIGAIFLVVFASKVLSHLWSRYTRPSRPARAALP